jgi:hypothetical protein
MSFFTGCAAQFGNERQYNNGNWYCFASSSEVARIKQDKMALEKMKTGDNTMGFKGTVVNLSKSENYNFIINGPEKKAYFLQAREKIEDYLILGDYTFKIMKGGELVGFGAFSVGLQTSKFNNISYHWFVYADR